MKNKKILVTFLIIFLLQMPVFAQKTTMEKLQKGADIYFTITQRLNLSLNQQRKVFGIKLEQMYHLEPLLREIQEDEKKLQELSYEAEGNREEIQKLNEVITLKKALTRQKKQYYISRYKGILTQEQLDLFDELVFDIANGYLKL